MVSTIDEKPEIAFFDVETTVPTRPRQGFAILEFGAILVCPRKLVELHSYSTLVRPSDLSHISSLSVRCNGITRDAVVSAPSFADIADVVYEILHGRIWAGHNILRFDCARIREAFSEINRPPPEPKGTIDSLALLTQKFGRRAGDMKMATLATYFGLGQQTHRSLDDVRMNLEVLKYCATVLFLESSLPDIFTENSWVSPNATTRSRRKENSSAERTERNTSMSTLSIKVENDSTSSPPIHRMGEIHPILSLVTPNTGELDPPLVESNLEKADPFNMVALHEEVKREIVPDVKMEDENAVVSSQGSSDEVTFHEASDRCTVFLDADGVSMSSLSVSAVPFFGGTQKIQILHENSPLQLSCKCLKVRFGISSKFVDHAGRPRLNIVVNALPSLCNTLEAIDNLAHKLFIDLGSFSDWRRVVNIKPGYYNSPTVRLHLPTVADRDAVRCTTEIYQKDTTSTQRLVFSTFDFEELDSLLTPGILVDAFFSLDSYDYQQNAGLRLVARKLIVHSA
ncbi:protein NEN1-like [Primulina huaijiensis]|uniref:protein NEN1-like n=1 Tax=Primulina huaijiensis TaxID=1492673 RepID=UPI003CC77701